MLLTIAAGAVYAQGATRTGGFTIQHSAFKADFVTPEVAKQYGIERSKYRGVLSICVIRGEQDSPTPAHVPSRVKATAMNLSGLTKEIELRAVQEGGATYYVDDFPIINGEIVNFTIEALPEGETTPLKAKMTQEFYVD